LKEIAMKSTLLWALVILNLLLLGSFLGRLTRDNTALAQPAARPEAASAPEPAQSMPERVPRPAAAT
jgi:hypothetical protein